MKNSTTRFTDRVESYIKFRPHYPVALIESMKRECRLNRNSIVADIGCGPGFLAEPFLENGNRVFGIEPNQPMREAGERLLQRYPHFASIEGTAEATNLPAQSIDLITAGQSFHWFDQRRARLEFSRILKPDGYVVLVWNERRTDATSFLRAFEQLILKYGTDYKEIRHENVYEDIAGFFAPGEYALNIFDNHQRLDFTGLKGRLMSSSYVPAPGDRNFEAMIFELRTIFDQHRQADEVILEYDTKVYFGQLKN